MIDQNTFKERNAGVIISLDVHSKLWLTKHSSYNLRSSI